MSSEINRQWLLAARPQGMVKETDFAYHEAPIPAPADGEILVRNLYFAFDPAMRGFMNDRPSYIAPVQIGEVMRASCVGQVIASKKPGFKVGEFVSGTFGWQDYIATSGEGLPRFSKVMTDMPLTASLSVLGGTGHTAYFGLLDLGKPQVGETVVVSSAAGATGSVAGQIAKINSCRVIGIAGGPEKCDWVRDVAGFDAAIDYKSENVPARLRELCPAGIDVYFDNVGGETLDAVLASLALGARIVLCGAISRYNDTAPAPGPMNYRNLIGRRGRMEGFIIYDYAPRYDEANQALAAWVREGRLKYKEDIQEGFENAPRTLLRLFHGENFGRQLLKIAEPPLARS